VSRAREIHDELNRTIAEAIARVEREAVALGKERFDLATFERLLGRGPQAAREAGHREMYYLSYPDLRTLAEYAQMLLDVEPYEDAP
jgi:hypothetical protein